jgi:hypothetical protein
MHSIGQKKTATSSRKHACEQAQHAARWLAAYSGAKPSAQFACRVFGTNVPAIKKAAKALANGHNGNGDPVPVIELEYVVAWWSTATDAQRATFVRTVGVGSAWNAIVANLG